MFNGQSYTILFSNETEGTPINVNFVERDKKLDFQRVVQR